MIELLPNYTQQALRTNADAVGTYAHVTPDMIHASLGLCSESAELMISEPGSLNEAEELGDLLWFCNLMLHALGRELNTEFMDEIQPDPSVLGVSASNGIQLLTGEIADIIKKSYAYGKTLDADQIIIRVALIVIGVAQLAEWIEEHDTVVKIQQMNIDKLKARYPEKFTTEKALNRDLNAETEALANA